ncbi:MAG TPA: hypothetical protein VH436_27555 [Vicinamibacterales bacterium]
MSVEEMPDPILRALARLRPITPSTAHDDRVRLRCHNALARQRRIRSARARTLDVALAAGVALYVAIGVTEAAWLAFTL